VSDIDAPSRVAAGKARIRNSIRARAIARSLPERAIDPDRKELKGT